MQETISAAGLTLKRNSCRSKQSTLEEVVQIVHWWPVQWSMIDIEKDAASVSIMPEARRVVGQK